MGPLEVPARLRRGGPLPHLPAALAGCGIVAFATSANAGWPLEVVAAEGEPYHRYALILVE